MRKSAKELVREATSDVSSLSVPDPLQQSISRHQNSLLGLANALLSAGKEESEIRDALDSVFASYKDELARTIVALREEAE